MADTPVLVWFRQDLRLTDNPALSVASAIGAPIIPLYVLDDETPGNLRMGGASRWWLDHSLVALDTSLRQIGSELVLRRGAAERELARLLEETGARSVYWNRCYEPFAVARDTRIKQFLSDKGIDVHSFNAALLFEPWEIETKAGDPYKVFTPFWRACLNAPPRPDPLPPPAELICPDEFPKGDRLKDWDLSPTQPNWAAEFEDEWYPGEDAALALLDDFLERRVTDYATGRDRPDKRLTSRLSPYLHFGEIGPRQIWHAVDRKQPGADKFLSEIGWREFCYHLLSHFPSIPAENLRPAFDDFPWRDDPDGLRAWQQGKTGYPIVDAGMRELWRTGWMHNRVRMISASFLIKDLLIDWRLGEAWFRDTLVDADLANNACGWQWVAGSGADAAPFFRIFNPVTQGQKFDPDGVYVRRFVPEIASLPDKWIHRPWDAPDQVLTEAGVILNDTYPAPIVDHASARTRALEAFKSIKSD